jgi:hypothetical protein
LTWLRRALLSDGPARTLEEDTLVGRKRGDVERQEDVSGRGGRARSGILLVLRV